MNPRRLCSACSERPTENKEINDYDDIVKVEMTTSESNSAWFEAEKQKKIAIDENHVLSHQQFA